MSIKLFSFFDESTGYLTTQSAPYIEDGWYIQARPDGRFYLFEIPLHGGEDFEIDDFDNFQLAYEKALQLT